MEKPPLIQLPFRSKGTVVYKMKMYTSADRFTLNSGDIIINADENNKVWVLVRQAER